ncbi:MAG: hypothetical protein JNK32_11725 [Anaerolineales bacterium]|nr:hypothetical protein [Anaerolineales bacterium]
MKWIIVALIALTAAWMFFDGSQALIDGDYVAPTSSEYAGQLGPWAGFVGSIGIDPHSTFMKAVFVVYGLAGLIAAAGYASELPWGGKALLVVAVTGLWYLPFGTFTGILALILFWFHRSSRLRSLSS